MVKVILLALALLSSTVTWARQISIIIDDLGHKPLDFSFLELDRSITLALLPHSPYADQLAERAHSQGRTVMLHMPMQGSSELALGPYGLEAEQQEQAFKDKIEKAIVAYPQASGLNNHMGSSLTQNEQAMHWLMQVLEQHALFFVDSRTHVATVAERVARSYQLDVTRRHVFLDHVDHSDAIAAQWQRALRLTEKQQHVVLIAHPRENTLSFLRQLTLPDEVSLVALPSHWNRS